MLESISNLRLISEKMHWLGARQKVVAGNVANADTPGYRAKDVESFDSYLDGARKSGINATHARHIGSGTTGGIDIKDDATPWESKPNGNSVNIEAQSILATEISGDYTMASKLYQKSVTLLKLAASKG